MRTATENNIRLIVGLGNPGKEYAGTRHNAGFEVVDSLLTKLPGTFTESSGCSSVFWKGRFRGRNIFLQKPMTFMNLSGQAVIGLMRRNRIEPHELMLIYDDVDLPLGKLRIRTKGSSAGHRGVESVINALGSSDFSRIRIGIGSVGKENQIDHVLSEFDESEKIIFKQVETIAVDAAMLALSRGVTAAMDSFNGIFISGDESLEDNKR